MGEENVAAKIIEILENAGIKARKDGYGNVYAEFDGGNPDKPSLLLSSHMDDTPVNIVESGGFIETDKTRTLGADDKAGVAAIVKLFLDMKAEGDNSKTGEKPLYGRVEAVFTRDEENSMTGIENVEFNRLNSEYALVLDSDKLGNFEISGAGYIKLTITVKTPYGGHSGLDIGDKKRLNAAKLIAEIVEKVPQGVQKADETGTITSINLGSIIGGGVENALYEAVKRNLKGSAAVEFVAKNSMSNIINTQAHAHYSIRSSDIKAKDALIDEIQNTAKKAASKAGINLKIQSFHAGAETHIYANRKNAEGKAFKPVLAGISDVYNMHSADEKIDIQSYKKGYEFLKAFLLEL